jgi:hypothetical protein
MIFFLTKDACTVAHYFEISYMFVIVLYARHGYTPPIPINKAFKEKARKV